MPREWFTDEGWKVNDKVNQDSERMAELRRTYGRILEIVKQGHIRLDEAQGIFRRAGLPQYNPGGKNQWRGRVEVYTNVNEFISEDIAADKKKINAAWKEFLVKTGLKGYNGYPAFTDRAGGAQVKIADKDTEPLLGNPMWNYDPVTLPDGSRLLDIR